MDYLTRAKELYDETVAHRRWLHQHPEVGCDLPQTVTYLWEALTGLGYAPRLCGGGIVATVGKAGGRTILLRSDLDALPMKEESGLPFASTGEAAHTCGHDCHGAQLLTAAKLLKENEAALAGTVKLMFQPGEETFQGARAMLADGLLEDPVPDAALSFHVAPGQMSPAVFLYNATGTMMHSVDGFRILVRGKGAHGAYPADSVDPINLAVHLYLALEALSAREVPGDRSAVLTVGRFQAGTAYNIIPDTAELQGSLRTDDPALREKLTGRIEAVARGVAATYGGSVEIQWLAQVPPLRCDPQTTRDFVLYLEELPVPGQTAVPEVKASASDDFACILEQVPGAYLYLSAGFPDRPAMMPHSPDVQFNEAVLRLAPAYLAHCATRWLEEHPQ